MKGGGVFPNVQYECLPLPEVTKFTFYNISSSSGGEKMSLDATWAEFQKKALLRLKKHIFWPLQTKILESVQNFLKVD